MVTSIFQRLLILSVLLTLTACASVRYIPAPSTPTLSFDIELPEPIFEPIDLPMPILEKHQYATILNTEAELECLAKAIYFEARSEPHIGQVAVGYVILNRMADDRFPDTACGVVYQKRRGLCQFSWHCTDARVRYPALYANARAVAAQVRAMEVDNPIGESLFFNSFRRSGGDYKIGGHRFYASWWG